MGFRDNFPGITGKVFSQLGQVATFTGVSSVECYVIVDHDVLIQADGYDVGVATLGTTISAQVADVGTPSRGNTFLIDGTTYTVQRIEENDNVVVKVVVK